MFKLYAIISFAVPFLMLGIPIFDICFAIIRRLAKHQNPMKADRGKFTTASSIWAFPKSRRWPSHTC